MLLGAVRKATLLGSIFATTAVAALASAGVAQADCTTNGTSPCHWTFNSGTSDKNSPNETIAYPSEALSVKPTTGEWFTGYYQSGSWYPCSNELWVPADTDKALCSNYLSGTVVHALMNTGGSNYTWLYY